MTRSLPLYIHFNPIYRSPETLRHTLLILKGLQALPADMVTFQCVDVPGESSEAQPVCCCSFFPASFFFSTSVFGSIFITASFCVKDEGSQGGRKEGAACVHPGSVQRGGKPVFPLQRTSGER